MHRGVQFSLATLLGFLMFGSGLAQEKPLRVEIVTAAPRHREPILVHVTNLTAKTIQLALPLYGRQTVASDPLDIKQRKRLGWTEIPLTVAGPRPKASPQIEPGETRE